MNCDFIGKLNIYDAGVIDGQGANFKDTLFHRTAFDWYFASNEEACVTSVTLFIQSWQSPLGPSADNGDDLIAQVRFITAAHGTDIFELTMPQGQKQAFSVPTPPAYLLEGADGDGIELWMKNPTRDYLFRYGCEFIVWDAA